jgi:hypothetical protein
LTGAQFVALIQGELKTYGLSALGDRKKLAHALTVLKENLV